MGCWGWVMGCNVMGHCVGWVVRCRGCWRRMVTIGAVGYAFRIVHTTPADLFSVVLERSAHEARNQTMQSSIIEFSAGIISNIPCHDESGRNAWIFHRPADRTSGVTSNRAGVYRMRGRGDVRRRRRR